MDLEQLILANEEVERWREMCRKLLITGAVTKADMAKPATDLSTPGTQLLQSIREWGDALVILRKGGE